MQRTVQIEDAREGYWQMVEEIRADNEGVNTDQVERDVAAVDAVRAEQRRVARARFRHRWDELKPQGSDLDPEDAERLALDEIASYPEERQRAVAADQEE